MGGKSSAPRPDPAIGAAAQANAEIGHRAQDLAEQNWQWNKELTEKYAPIYEQLLNTSIEQSEQNVDHSKDQWGQYKSIFQPIENQMAAEAVNYDSPEETARREAQASADVARQFDASRDQTAREMGRMGVSPTSSMGLQAMTDQGNAQALGQAGAITKARNDTKLLGMSLRQDAARFGRNQTGTGLAASAAALQGGQSAGGIMGSQTAQGNAAGNAQGLMGTAVQGHSSAGNMMLNQWQTQVQAHSQAQSGLGSLFGTIGGIAGNLGAAKILASSEKLKEDKTPASDKQALAGLMKVPVEEWKYKEGVADEGRHTGPYAEDMHKQFGNGVAPGGVGLDMISVSGKHHAAIRALGKEVKALKKQIGLEPIDTEPKSRRSALPPELEGDMTAGLVGLSN